MAELVDALDLGSSIFDVRVRVSPFAPFLSEWIDKPEFRQPPGENPNIENHEISACKYQ